MSIRSMSCLIYSARAGWATSTASSLGPQPGCRQVLVQPLASVASGCSIGGVKKEVKKLEEIRRN